MELRDDPGAAQDAKRWDRPWISSSLNGGSGVYDPRGFGVQGVRPRSALAQTRLLGTIDFPDVRRLCALARRTHPLGVCVRGRGQR